MQLGLTVNGERRTASIAGWESLLDVLRDDLRLPGTKGACEQGECGSCSVVLDGLLVCSCLVMAGDCAGSEVLTVEGIAPEGVLHRVQRAMLDHGGVQCGFCTPGFVVAATHYLEGHPDPSPEDLQEALAGNICRCTGYGGILRGLQALAGGEETA